MTAMRSAVAWQTLACVLLVLCAHTYVSALDEEGCGCGSGALSRDAVGREAVSGGDVAAALVQEPSAVVTCTAEGVRDLTGEGSRPGDEALLAAEREAAGKLRVKVIQAELKRRGVNSAGLVEKGDLVNALALARVRMQRTAAETMVRVPGGAFVMGTNVPPPYPGDGEGPPRLVVVSSFSLDEAEVSNNQFAEFVAETGYVTESETFGWSFVFHLALTSEAKEGITEAVHGAEWWLPVKGATWRSPEGPGSDVFSGGPVLPQRGGEVAVAGAGRSLLAPNAPSSHLDFPGGRGNHPVVHVSWADAVRYCEWRSARLPTEAEWEYAAQYRSDPMQRKSLFPWGDELLDQAGSYRMNIWQGDFPNANDGEDGWRFTAPAEAMEPQNELGLRHMLGNVWEWVEDWWTVDHRTPVEGAATTQVSVVTDPVTMAATNRTAALDPTGPRTGDEKTKKGGSFLCHHSFCYRYFE